ncbi:hypothetical protein H5P36_25495 [Bacillus sp. APMAM]|nr:hypothetical protein [Bacillus sp. APMAM]RTZ53079.1 hypothetical protein EKO25_25340 [Bacillus sp. SAJ1]
MKKIQLLWELVGLKQMIHRELGDYLEEEFFSLYDYLSNGKQVDEFALEPYQAMVLLEEKGELSKLLSNPLKLEFIEEVKLNRSTVLRIGILSIEDVQLCYVVK